MLCITKIARADGYLERTLIPLLIVINRWTWYQIVRKIMRNILSKVFAEELFFVRLWRTKTRKNACFARFLKNAYNGLKRMQKKFKTILSNIKFYARINARTYAYAQFCAHLSTWNWPDKYWPWSWQIWMRNGFLLWRYDHELIFTKWRLDDVTITSSLWKVTQF